MHTRVSAGSLAAASILAALGAAAIVPLARRSLATHPKSGKPIALPARDGDSTLLFNGWRITPAGRPIDAGDMLLGGAISPDGATLAIANCGYNAHALHLIDLAAEKETARIPLAKAWNGIAWSPDGARIYVAGGISNAENDVYVVEKGPDGWRKAAGIRLTGAERAKTCIAGLALAGDGRTLFALNNSDGHLYAVSTETGQTSARIPIGDHPLSCRLARDEKRLFATCWGGSEIAVVDVSAPGSPVVSNRVRVGDHPNDLIESASGLLYVSCGNSDEVTVVDVKTGKATESVKTSLTPRAPYGSTPNAVTLSPDGATLYAANADNNAICVVDVSQRGRSRVAGFIPTGWYPTSVHMSRDGRKLFVGSGKGTGSRPNPARAPINPQYVGGFEYIGRQLNGQVAAVDVPNAERLAEYTRQVYANSPYRDEHVSAAEASGRTAIPSRVGAKGPIQYVLYIIKENRTYDQVFGDMPKGNGDPSLTLFGRDVTPNHHALAEQFVLLDNLYCNGEVSADGHPWSTSAIATDFTQRSWVLSYSGKGSTERTDSVADPRSGYIWQACDRSGITFRTYGEYANHRSLKDHSSLEYIGKPGTGSPPPGRDTDRAAIFIREFKRFESEGKIPRFTIMSLGEDHTNGTRAGAHTPRAMVASNDQALGMIVDAVTHSSVWKETAIFVIQDDAQNGPDHVDSHRTVGLVISPYARRGIVDSTMYTTASMLRTMELILGLKPLTQYDAAATPLFASFSDRADLTPFSRLEPRISLTDKNPATAYGARASGRMDFSEYDRIDEDALNRILWHSIKGRSTPYPVPVRRALPMAGRLAAAGSRTAEDD